MARDAAYRRAEQQIEAARSSGATELDLSQKYDAQDSEKLTELPDSLWKLTQLQTLSLKNNLLPALPESLGNLTQLRHLNLSGNRLKELPETIGQLIHLIDLDLGGEDYREAKNQLTTLPDSLSNLSLLRSLNISKNQLTILPEWIKQLVQLQSLDISDNQITTLPEWLGNLRQLESLSLSKTSLTALPDWLRRLDRLKRLEVMNNQISAVPEWFDELELLQSVRFDGNKLTDLPDSFGNLRNLVSLIFGYFPGNPLVTLPDCISRLHNLVTLYAYSCKLNSLPIWLGDLTKLQTLGFYSNLLTDLPPSLAQLEHLQKLELDNNPLNPELAAAYEQGLDAVKAYLRAKAEGGEIVLNEAKLILVGEGEVGKTSLLAALRGEEFVEKRPTTHGVEVVIKSLVVQTPDNGTEISLNGWDFGGQNIYRHTHQLFFTAPAVYLAVWEPRRGPEQCRVAEWIKIVKHRAYDEARPGERPRILIVATHGGPTERLAHIDEQALRDEFGDLIAGFHHVDSKPGDDGVCYGLDELKAAIGREAAAIPSVGRTVPLSWKNVLDAIRRHSEQAPYIHYAEFESLCEEQGVSHDLAATYAVILNELGHLIYYRGDETLKDTVILKADYLSKAVSFVLEDKATKDARGLVEHQRLRLLWHDPNRPADERYPPELHPIFLRLMTKFDLSYQVVMPQADAPDTSLMAQLVPGVRPDGWEDDWTLKPGDVERAQICRVLDKVTGRTVEAEGLMYRLIVRLHRYSLGRKNYYNSRHWKTGLILDDSYNGRAFIEEIGGDVYITVRAAYPERFLAHLCAEVQWLVEHFWKGLDARLYVPCPTETCKGLLELGEIMDFKSAGIPKVRCAVCKQFHEIDGLMTTMQPKPAWSEMLVELRDGQRQMLRAQEHNFEQLSTQLRNLMSQADEQYVNLVQATHIRSNI